MDIFTYDENGKMILDKEETLYNVFLCNFTWFCLLFPLSAPIIISDYHDLFSGIICKISAIAFILLLMLIKFVTTILFSSLTIKFFWGHNVWRRMADMIIEVISGI